MQDATTRNEFDTPALSTADIANPNRTLAAADARDPLSTGNAAAAEHTRQPLFPSAELQEFRGQWDRAQGLFVDDPRKAVEQADSLVAGTIQRIAQQFADERGRLEAQWDKGEDVSTEDLRQAIRRYRDFFDRLLSL